ALSDRRRGAADERTRAAGLHDDGRLESRLTPEPAAACAVLSSNRQRTETHMTETKIFARLKADHDRHRELLDRIDATHGDSDERRALFEAFRVEVTAHAASEEMSLYATMLAN